MNYYAIGLLLALLLLSCRLIAQPWENRPYFQIAYFGILGAHPGLKIGVQYPLHTLNREEVGERLHQFIGAANLLVYYHRRNHIGLGLTAEVSFRNRRAGGLNKELSLGLGYLRAIRPNRVYDFDVAGEMTPRRFVGHHYLIKTAALGLGGNAGMGLRSDFWMIKPTLVHRSPVGIGSTLNFALDAGFYFRR